jgi:hypothetical protein
MISKDLPEVENEAAEMPEETEEHNGLAQKLSKELSNWRRQRTTSRPRRSDDGMRPAPQSSEPARTIKVRGHETLVIRKAKLLPRPSTATD